MAEESLTTEQKAFAVNMDLAKYGAFAEIGAGQEVARWFFRAGGCRRHRSQDCFGIRHGREQQLLRQD